jgi:hypothetical protein
MGGVKFPKLAQAYASFPELLQFLLFLELSGRTACFASPYFDELPKPNSAHSGQASPRPELEACSVLAAS